MRTDRRLRAAFGRRAAGALLALAALAGLAACSSQQLYSAGQAWQRTECHKLNDAQERNRCLASSATSYEQYQRAAQPAAPKP